MGKLKKKKVTNLAIKEYLYLLELLFKIFLEGVIRLLGLDLK